MTCTFKRQIAFPHHPLFKVSLKDGSLYVFCWEIRKMSVLFGLKKKQKKLSGGMLSTSAPNKDPNQLVHASSSGHSPFINVFCSMQWFCKQTTNLLHITLTHFSLETPKRVTGKQCRSRSDPQHVASNQDLQCFQITQLLFPTNI